MLARWMPALRARWGHTAKVGRCLQHTEHSATLPRSRLSRSHALTLRGGAVCAEFYFSSGNGALCQPCEGSTFLTFLPAIIFGLIALALIWRFCIWYHREDDSLGMLQHTGRAAAVLLALETFCDGRGLMTDMQQDRAEDEAAERILSCLGQMAERRCPRRVGVFIRWIERKFGKMAVKLRILISLFQMLSGIGVTFAIPYPDFYKDVVRWISSIVQIDLPSAMPFDCFVPIGFGESLVLRTLGPLLVIIVLSGMGKLFSKLAKKEQHAKNLNLNSKKNVFVVKSKKKALGEMCSHGWFYVLFLVYPSCSAAVFQTFMCDEMEDGRSFLRVDYSIQCYEEAHARMVAYALIMMIYPFGTPLLYALLLYARRDQLAFLKRLEHKGSMQLQGLEREEAVRKEQMAKDVIHTIKQQTRPEAQRGAANIAHKWRKKTSNGSQGDTGGGGLDEPPPSPPPTPPPPSANGNGAVDVDMIRKLRAQGNIAAREKYLTGFASGQVKLLTTGYHMRTYWFEVFECLRKIMLVGLPVFFSPAGSAAQLIMGLFVCFISFGMYMHFAPFSDPSDDRLSKVCQVALFFALVSSIALKMERESSAGTMDVLLTITMAIPPICAFFVDSDEDLVEVCHLGAVRRFLARLFGCTFGRCIDHISLLVSSSSSGSSGSSANKYAVAADVATAAGMARTMRPDDPGRDSPSPLMRSRPPPGMRAKTSPTDAAPMPPRLWGTTRRLLSTRPSQVLIAKPGTSTPIDGEVLVTNATVDPDGTVVGPDANPIGTVRDDGMVVGDDGTPLGKMADDQTTLVAPVPGDVLHPNTFVLGEQTFAGTMQDDGKVLGVPIGKLRDDGMVVAPGGHPIGRRDPEGSIVAPGSEDVLHPNTSVTAAGMVLSVEGEELGRVRVDGAVERADGKVIGRRRSDGSVTPAVKAASEAVPGAGALPPQPAFLQQPASSSSSSVLEEEPSKDDNQADGRGAIVLASTAVRDDGMVVAAQDGRPLGMLQADGTVVGSDGITVVGRRDQNGVVRAPTPGESLHSTTTVTAEGVVMAADGKQLGKTRPDGMVVGTDGTTIVGKKAADGSIVAPGPADVLHAQTSVDAQGVVSGPAGEPLGTLREDGVVVGPTGALLGQRDPDGAVRGAATPSRRDTALCSPLKQGSFAGPGPLLPSPRGRGGVTFIDTSQLMGAGAPSCSGTSEVAAEGTSGEVSTAEPPRRLSAAELRSFARQASCSSLGSNLSPTEGSDGPPGAREGSGVPGLVRQWSYSGGLCGPGTLQRSGSRGPGLLQRSDSSLFGKETASGDPVMSLAAAGKAIKFVRRLAPMPVFATGFSTEMEEERRVSEVIEIGGRASVSKRGSSSSNAGQGSSSVMDESPSGDGNDPTVERRPASASPELSPPETTGREQRAKRAAERMGLQRTLSHGTMPLARGLAPAEDVTTEAEVRTKVEAEVRAKVEAEMRAKLEAEAKEKAEVEAAAKAKAEENAELRRQLEQVKAEAAAKAKAEADAKAKADAEAKAEEEARLAAEEERRQREEEAQKRAEREERQRREAAELRKHEEEQRQRREEADRQRHEEEQRRRVAVEETMRRYEEKKRREEEAAQLREEARRRVLYDAVQKHDKPTVDSLLAQGLTKEQLDYQDPNTQLTALHVAASEGQSAFVEALVTAGADRSLKTNHGETALQWAKELMGLPYNKGKEAEFNDVVRLLEGRPAPPSPTDAPPLPMRPAPPMPARPAPPAPTPPTERPTWRPEPVQPLKKPTAKRAAPTPPGEMAHTPTPAPAPVPVPMPAPGVVAPTPALVPFAAALNAASSAIAASSSSLAASSSAHRAAPAAPSSNDGETTTAPSIQRRIKMFADDEDDEVSGRSPPAPPLAAPSAPAGGALPPMPARVGRGPVRPAPKRERSISETPWRAAAETPAPVYVPPTREDMVKKHETDMEKHAARMKKVREGK